MRAQSRVISGLLEGRSLPRTLGQLVELLEQHAPGGRVCVAWGSLAEGRAQHCLAPRLPGLADALTGVALSPGVFSSALGASEQPWLALCARLGVERVRVSTRDAAPGLRVWVLVCEAPDLGEDGTIAGVASLGSETAALALQIHQRLYEPSSAQSTIANPDEVATAHTPALDGVRYRAIVDAQLEMVCRFRLDGTIIYANHAYAGARGLTPESITNANFWQFIPESEHARVRAMLDRLTPENPVIQIENCLQTLAGPRWTLWTNRALEFDAQGKVIEAQSTGTDITERRRAELALKSSEQRFKLLADSAPVMIWQSDQSGKCVWFNRRWLDFVGRSLEQEAGDGWAQGVHPDDAEACMETFLRASAARRSFVMEYRLRRYDGVYRLILDHGEPLIDERGVFRGFIGSCLDVSEQAEAQAALRESEARLLVAKDAAKLGIHQFDIASGEFQTDDRVREFWGLAPEQPSTIETFFEGVHPDDREHVRDSVRHAISQGRDGRYEIEHRVVSREDGLVRWVVAMGRTTRGVDGRLLLVGSVKDITSRKQAEEALRESEERSRRAQQAGRVGVWEFDPRTLAAKWSDVMCELHGMDASDGGFVDEKFWIRVHPEDRDRMRAKRDAWIWGAFDLLHEEYRVVLPDGSERWLEVKADARRDAIDSNSRATLAGVVIDITERKRTEERLTSSESILRLATQSAQLGVYEWRVREDVAIWGNDRMYELFGRTREEGPVSPEELFRSYLHPDDAQAVRDELARAHASWDVVQLCARVRRKGDAAWRWFEWFGRFVPAEGSSPERLFGVVGDVTDRKLAEQALRDSERQFKMIADAAPAMLWVVDERGVTTFLSHAWYRFTGQAFTGQTSGQGVGHGRLEMIHPDDRAGVASAWADALARRAPYAQDYRVKVGDGTYRWVADSGRPRFDSGAAFVGYVGSIIDIHERKEAEAALRQSEERFRTLADNMSQLAWMADASGYLFWYNRRWYEYTGTKLQDMAGWGWRGVHHPEHLDRVERKFREHLMAGEAWEDTFPLRSASGEYRWFLSRAIPIRDESGNVVRWFGTNTDVTRQLEVERQLEEHKADLERRVEDRTRELLATHERLRLSERMAMMGSLSAGLGHDMGNLLVPVRVRLESLAQHVQGGPAREDVEAIRVSAEYLRRLASGLRMLAIDPSRSPRTEVTDVVAWWSEAQGVLRSVLPRGVSLEGEFKPGLQARVSRAALTQVVFNLVQNAGDVLKDRPGGRVQVRARGGGPLGVRLEVTDNGPGMTPEVAARCMEPYFTTKTRGISTGLGLVLVFGLIREAEGTVAIDSTLGVGTTFRIDLRAAQTREDVQRSPRTAVVDLGDPRWRSFVASEFKSLGWRVENAVGVGEGTCDVVVTDDASKIHGSPARARVILLAESHHATTNGGASSGWSGGSGGSGGVGSSGGSSSGGAGEALGDHKPEDRRVRVLGSRPGMQVLREVLQEITMSVREPSDSI
ncbi:MAG: PAS domain S-box protein [Planctomycetota bacterium]|nr:PAS domain S-box protein [Planctomycetota bacterium]